MNRSSAPGKSQKAPRGKKGSKDPKEAKSKPQVPKRRAPPSSPPKEEAAKIDVQSEPVLVRFTTPELGVWIWDKSAYSAPIAKPVYKSVLCWESTVMELWRMMLHTQTDLPPNICPRLQVKGKMGLVDRKVLRVINERANTAVTIVAPIHFSLYCPMLAEEKRMIHVLDLVVSCNIVTMPKKTKMFASVRAEDLFKDIPADSAYEFRRFGIDRPEKHELVSPYIYNFLISKYGVSNLSKFTESEMCKSLDVFMHAHTWYEVYTSHGAVEDLSDWQDLAKSTRGWVLLKLWHDAEASKRGGEGFAFFRMFKYGPLTDLLVHGMSRLYDSISWGWLSGLADVWSNLVRWVQGTYNWGLTVINIKGGYTVEEYSERAMAEAVARAPDVEDLFEEPFAEVIAVQGDIDPVVKKENGFAYDAFGCRVIKHGRRDVRYLNPEAVIDNAGDIENKEKQITYHRILLGLPLFRPSGSHILSTVFFRAFTEPPPYKPEFQDHDILHSIAELLVQGFQYPYPGELESTVYDEAGFEYYTKRILPFKSSRKRKRDEKTMEAMEVLWKSPMCQCSDEVAETMKMDQECWDALVGQYTKDMNELENPVLFTKPDELLHANMEGDGLYDDLLEVVKAKPRLITNVPNGNYLATCVAVHKYYQYIKGLKIQEVLFGATKFTLCILTGAANPATLSDWLNEALAHDGNLLIFANAGDDDMFIIRYKGIWICGANDFSMYDQSECHPEVNSYIFDLMVCLGFPRDQLTTLFSAFGGAASLAINRFLKVWITMMMGSGNGMTTLWNTLLNHVKTLFQFALFIQMLDEYENRAEEGSFDDTELEAILKECVTKSDLAMGLSSKLSNVRLSTEPEPPLAGLDYLKGWWIPTTGGWCWSPLPSRLCKMFKSRKKLAVRNFDRLNYEVARANRISSVDPILNSLFDQYIDSVPEAYLFTGPQSNYRRYSDAEFVDHMVCQDRHLDESINYKVMFSKGDEVDGLDRYRDVDLDALYDMYHQRYDARDQNELPIVERMVDCTELRWRKSACVYRSKIFMDLWCADY